MTQAPCTNRLEARGDRAHHPRNFGDALSADHEVLRSACAASLRSRGAGPVSLWIQSYPTKNKNCAGSDEQFAQFLPSDQNTQVLLIQTKTWNLSVLAETCVDITTSQARTDQKQTDLPKKHFAGSEKEPLPFWFSRGLSAKMVSEQMECFSYQRNVQNKLADRKSTIKEDVGFHLMVQTYQLGTHFILIQTLRKMKVVLINLGQRCFQEYSSDTRGTLEEVGPET